MWTRKDGDKLTYDGSSAYHSLAFYLKVLYVAKSRKALPI